MANAIETQGTCLKIDGVEVGEVVDFQGPGGQATVIDVTHLKSTAREKLIGLPDEGQFTFSMNFVPGEVGQKALRAARTARTKHTFVLEYSDGVTTATFEGFVLGFQSSGGVDAKVDANVTIEITGAVTYND